MHKLPILSLSLLLGACAADNSSDKVIQLDAGLPAVETVNGTPVPQALVDAFVRAKARGADLSNPEQRAKVMRVLTDYVLLAQQAKRDNLLAKPEFAADVELARLTTLADATMADLRAQTPLTDDALKAEYDAQVAKASKVEYDFSQLLFGNEDDAVKANGEILGGKSFEKVYNEWKEKAKQSKVFTRVRPEQLPEALSKALADMKSGETSKTPIKTQFGWHLVHLDVVNPFTPPPFEQAKENIRRILSMRIGQERMEKLQEQATITYPPGSAPPPDKNVPAPASADTNPAAPATAKPEPGAPKKE